MKDFKDILNSGISDELLAAYIDGNTTESENALIENALSDDSMLSEACEIICDISQYADSHPSDPGLLEAISLIDSHIEIQNTINGINNVEEMDKPHLNSVFEDQFGFTTPKIEQMSNISIEETSLPNTSTAIYEARKQYGLEPVNIEFDPNTYQWEEDTCAIRSQEIVLRSYGIFVSQDELVQQAKAHCWYSEGSGTPMDAVGNLLDLYQIPNHRIADANVFNLADELGQGHKVIVGVDINELYGNSFWQSIKEHLIGKTPNHAMIVSGLNTSDTNCVTVTLTDPGTGKTLFECPYERFLSAWDDSKCFMVATNSPAPLQYNVDTMMNFDYKNGHVASIGKISFDDFHNHVVPNVDNYLDSIDEYIEAIEQTMQNGFNINDFNDMMDKAVKVHNQANEIINHKNEIKSNFESSLSESSTVHNEMNSNNDNGNNVEDGIGDGQYNEIDDDLE